MRGTPNEFFSFLPDEERTAAIQAFAIIRRCDDALRFEALIGSWLVSCLITILRMDMDSAAIVTSATTAATTATTTTETETETKEETLPPTQSPSTTTTTATGEARVVASFGSQGEKNSNSGLPTNAPAPTPTPTPTLAPLNDKPLFMYVGHLQSSGAAAMNGFATNLAGIISSFSTTKGTSTTVASTISYCLHLLENSKQKDRLLNGLCSIIIHSHTHAHTHTHTHTGTSIMNEGLAIPEKARTDLKRILTTALCCILLQVKTSCEAVQDFEYIWEYCKDQQRQSQSQSHGQKGPAITSIFEDNIISKESSWLLCVSAYLSLSSNNNSRDDGNDDGNDDDDDDDDSNDVSTNVLQSLSHADRRQARLILSGACISIVAQSALWLKQRQREHHHRHDDRMTMDTTMGMTKGGTTNATTSSATNIATLLDSNANARITLENEAIHQLCMLGKKDNNNDNDNSKANDASIQNINETKYNKENKQTTTTSILDLVLSAIHELSPPSDNNNKVTTKQLFKEQQKAIKVASKMKLLDKEEYNHNNTHHEQQHQQQQPIQSMFSTYHGRRTSINILTKFCHTLLNTSQNSHSTNGPSIFTGFSFVDETLLVAQRTTYVRLYLIDFNERMPVDSNSRSTAAVGHVAAEVQFYKGSNSHSHSYKDSSSSGGGGKKEEPTIESEEDDQQSNPQQQQQQLNTKKMIKFKGEMKYTLELNMWTEILLESSTKRIKPSTKLLFYIGSSNVKSAFALNRETVGQVMIPVINKALGRLSQTSTNNNNMNNDNNTNNNNSKDMLIVDQTGGMRAFNLQDSKGDNNNNNKTSSLNIRIQANTIGRAMLSLYYDSLESILDYETAILKITSHRGLLLSPPFHKALLSICLICVVHGTSGPSSTSLQQENNGYGSHLFVQSILKLMDCTAYEYMKVSESFGQSMEKSSKSIYHKICCLPTLLRQKLQDTEEEILEMLLWSRCLNTETMRTTIGVIDYFTTFKKNDIDITPLWPPSVLKPIQGQEVSNSDNTSASTIIDSKNTSTTDSECFTSDPMSEINYVDYLMTKLMSLVSTRVALLCGHLGIPPHYQVTKQIWYTFRQFLREKIHLLYGRHIDQLILCSIYGVCKAVKYSPEVTFSKIIQVYKYCFEDKLGKDGSHKIVQSIVLSKNQHGTVIDFYNQIYLPTMKKYLLKSKHTRAPALFMAKNKKKRSFNEIGIAQSVDFTKKAVQFSNKSAMKLQNSNLHLNISYNNKSLITKKESPKSRVLYSFGDASTIKNIDLINKTINC